MAIQMKLSLNLAMPGENACIHVQGLSDVYGDQTMEVSTVRRYVMRLSFATKTCVTNNVTGDLTQLSPIQNKE